MREAFPGICEEVFESLRQVLRLSTLVSCELVP